MNTLNILKRFNGEVKFASDKLIFYIPGERDDAELFVKLVSDNIVLALKNMNLPFAHICYQGMKKPIKLCAEMANTLNIERINMTEIAISENTGLQLVNQKLSISLLKVINYFFEQPEQRNAIVRLHDERQIAITESNSVLIKGVTLEEAAQRKRSDYWYLPDLEDFRRESKQKLEPNNENSFIEFSWRGVSKDKIDWRVFTNRYSLIQDNYGVFYQVSRNLNVDRIPAPPKVHK